jgi:phosphate transport system substrate-binding protein
LSSPNRRFLVAAAAASALALSAGACSSNSNTSTGSTTGSGGNSIKISGSSTVQPISSAVAEAYQKQNSAVGITVDGPGTGDGFKLFCNGEIDISDASRPIKSDEAEICKKNNVNFIELRVGIDGLTVATNPANTAVECLDTQAIYALVGPQSQGIGTWAGANQLAGEVGSKYTSMPDAKLDIYGPGEESGTYDSFVELAIEPTGKKQVEAGKLEKGKEKETRPDYNSSPNDNVIVQGIEGSPTSFGWVGYSFYVNDKERMKAIPIADKSGKCVEPTDTTIADGSYPLSRSLYIYVNADKAKSNPAVAPFVDFYLGDTGFNAVKEVGYVQIPKADWDKTNQTWKARTTGSASSSGSTGTTVAK